MQNNLTIFTNFKRQIFADLISGIYCGDLYFNKNENKAIFMEKIVTDLPKIAEINIHKYSYL